MTTPDNLHAFVPVDKIGVTPPLVITEYRDERLKDTPSAFFLVLFSHHEMTLNPYFHLDTHKLLGNSLDTLRTGIRNEKIAQWFEHLQEQWMHVWGKRAKELRKDPQAMADFAQAQKRHEFVHREQQIRLDLFSKRGRVFSYLDYLNDEDWAPPPKWENAFWALEDEMRIITETQAMIYELFSKNSTGTLQDVQEDTAITDIAPLFYGFMMNNFERKGHNLFQNLLTWMDAESDEVTLIPTTGMYTSQPYFFAEMILLFGKEILGENALFTKPPSITGDETEQYESLVKKAFEKAEAVMRDPAQYFEAMKPEFQKILLLLDQRLMDRVELLAEYVKKTQE